MKVESSESLEEERLAVVRRYDILDTPPDGAFDRITAIAARIFDAPISIISIVDHDRIWFKSHHGLDIEQIGRNPGLCSSAILGDDPYVIADAVEDIRSLANPLVAGSFGLRFYAGVPLRTVDGHNLGTLCVIDKTPRRVSGGQVEQLEALASVVMDQLELRLSARRVVAERDRALAHAETMAKETDHRVMNSLQLVSSLLTLQARGLKNAEAAAQLASAAARVSAVARGHRLFYQDDTVSTVSGRDYLRRLCTQLSALSRHAAITVEGSDVEIPAQKIVSVGLIINELVMNAIKHGGEPIVVRIEPQGNGACRIGVLDAGPGVSGTGDLRHGQGLGTKIVRALTTELGGRLVYGGDPDGTGTLASLTFKV